MLSPHVYVVMSGCRDSWRDDVRGLARPKSLESRRGVPQTHGTTSPRTILLSLLGQVPPTISANVALKIVLRSERRCR